jgi:polysaccharide export outer membrane protein
MGHPQNRPCATFFCILFALSLLCTACTTSTRTASLPDTAAEITPEEYVIGPEDVLEVSVWQNQDVSRVVSVRPDGKISLPLLHDIQAAGLTATELKEVIKRDLKPYIGAPEVTIIVQQINSWRIYVQGEVQNPGVYPIRSRTTLSQVISMTGGFTEFAKERKIQVVREGEGEREIIPIDYSLIIMGVAPAVHIDMNRGYTNSVPYGPCTPWDMAGARERPRQSPGTVNSFSPRGEGQDEGAAITPSP